MVKKLPNDFDIFSLSTCKLPVWIQYLQTLCAAALQIVRVHFHDAGKLNQNRHHEYQMFT